MANNRKTAPRNAGTAAAPVQYTSASLYIGDLETEVTEAALFEIFNQSGPVASVRVCRDAATRRSLGYAYVNFHRAEDAERALDTMNFKSINGKACRIMWSHRDPSLRNSGLGNIFVKNLSKTIDNKQLYDTFSIFGNILSCKVAVDANKESLGYGFVHYDSEQAAVTAIEKANGKEILGQKVGVHAFKSKDERGGNNRGNFTNVYVRNIAADCTQAELQALFEKFGAITSCVLALDQDQKVRGFGFVNFADPAEAAAAVEGLHATDFKGKELYVQRHQKKSERTKELREKFDLLKNERIKKYEGVNLYVKNLADSVDEAKLRAEFQKYGAIQSARVMVDANQKSKGFGFVCLTTTEEATKAVTEMNGRMLDGKPLYVALAQPKAVRRQQLQAQYAMRAKRMGPQGYPAGPGMYYQQQRPPPQMMYPMRGGRFPPNNQPMHMGRGPNMNFQLVPAHGMPPRGRPHPQHMGHPNQQQQQQQQPMNGQPQPRLPQKPPVVVNEQAAKPAPVAQPRPQPQAQPAPAQAVLPAGPQDEALTVKALAALPEEARKQRIGERLFPKIQTYQPELAGKITGMLLEMDNTELILLLESEAELSARVKEAMDVLEQAGQQE